MLSRKHMYREPETDPDTPVKFPIRQPAAWRGWP